MNDIKFDFHLGAKRTTMKEFIIIDVVLRIVVVVLSVVLKVSDEMILDLIDEIQKQYWPDGKVNDYFLNHPQLIARRVEREVDSAIIQYYHLTGHTEEVKVDEAVFTEDPFGETELGGDLRLTSPWDTNNNQQEL